MTEPLTPEERRCYADDGWRLHDQERLWDAYQALEARVEEAERKQAIDQRQCDEITSEAGRLARELSATEAQEKKLREAAALALEALDAGIPAPAVVALRWALT